MYEFNVNKLKKSLEKELKKEVLACSESLFICLISEDLFKLEFNIAGDTFKIENFHSYQENEGNGTLIINHILKYLRINFKYVKLVETNPDSLYFWGKFNFEYYDENDYMLEL